MKKWMKQQDPVVIAKALAIYDPTLRKPLIKALQEVEDAPKALKAAWQAYRDPEAVTTPDDHRAGDEAPDATQL